ncbi:uncharacterized protein PHLOEM PROTEIN 2-LIKE A4-like [Phoenix dactylifera]|uniref:Uncharacterized protein PHLOEM PROTEIN 2-LIKE A4-like n=1 Tax=Phoenix dactylifera TaxID=42345 RepID=A0A8B9AQS1_PHODC|nr:uncharacterized protein PHLOEM PROTEIN 2-LIKE A4-like [Phoenix dactylifera]
MSYQAHGPHWTGDHGVSEDRDGFHFRAKALDITWGNDSRFWQWVRLNKHESSKLKFDEGAELIQVNWIEVKGTLDAKKLSRSTYEVHYMIKFKDDAFGWHSSHITFQVTLPNGQKSRKTLVLENYRKACNVWHEIHGGEFSLISGTRGKVAFSMYGDDSEWWKGGIILGGVTIKPK